MNDFVHDDGQGNIYNDKDLAVRVVEMEMDEEMYPIKTVTNFGMYLDLKPPEWSAKRPIQQSKDAYVKIEEDTRVREV